MVAQGWLLLLIISGVLLITVIVRTKPDIRSFGYALLQLVIASVMLFLINGTGLFGDFTIPINLVTVLAIGVLGVPGLALLAAIQLTIV